LCLLRFAFVVCLPSSAFVVSSLFRAIENWGISGNIASFVDTRRLPDRQPPALPTANNCTFDAHSTK
jgi:hypothetical protein